MTNINNLTDCTKVLPQPITSFSSADKCQMQQWSKTSKPAPAVALAILEGKLINNLTIPRPSKHRKH